MEEATLTIGQVAASAGIETSAIRYYERTGVLPPAERRGGQRRYTGETVRRLAVIDTAKRAGLTLSDARTLLTAAEAGTPAHAQIRALAERRLPEVEALIERAQAMRGWLAAASTCECETLDACCLFDGESKPGAPPTP